MDQILGAKVSRAVLFEIHISFFVLILFIVITDRHAGRFNAVIDIVKYGVGLCLLGDLGSLASNI